MTTRALDTPLAHHSEAEQALIGAMLVAPGIVSDIHAVVTPADFYDPKHAAIFEAMLALDSEGHPVELASVATQLRNQNDYDQVGGLAYLMACGRLGAPSSAMYYADEVLDAATKRRVTDFHLSGLTKTRDGSGETGKSLITGAQTALDTLAEERAISATGTIGDALDDTINAIEAMGNADGGVTGLSTGFHDLDRMTYGLHPGQMICIAARPGFGKTTLALDIARACSVKQGLPAAFFSLEMGRQEIVMRLLSATAGVDLGRIRSGRLDDRDWDRIANKMDLVRSAPLFVDDTPGLSMGAIRAQARRLKQRHGLRLVIIDYLQLLTADERASSRQEEVSKMSRQVKLLAKELEVPVIAMSQLNRGNEQRSDPTPKISDLRESGAIEQDSDVVMLIHREDMYDPETARVGETDLILAKQRSAPTGTCVVAFQGAYSRFVDLAS